MDTRARLQRWLFLAAIGTTAALVALLFTVGIGRTRRGLDGEAVTFSSSPLSLVYGLGFALIPVLLGWAVGLRRGAFWVFAALLFGLGALAVATLVPVTFCQGVTVSDTGFTCRVGFWFAPIEHRIRFAQTAALQVVTREGRTSPFAGRSYDLLCYLEPDGQTVAVPVGDLMTTALPEILAAAGRHGVAILDTAEGWLIPPELSQRAQSPTARLRAAPGQLAVLAGGLCALAAWAWWGTRRPAPEQQLTATEACYVLYCLAVVVLVVAFHGETGVPQGIDQGEPTLRSLCLAVAATLAITGVVLHLVLWRRGRADPMATQKRWLGLVLLMGVVALAYERLEALKSGWWLVASVASLSGALFVAILAWVGVARFRAGRLPVNRMANRMRREDFAAAIAIGEAVPFTQRDAGVWFNLAQSYRRTGRVSEAREVLRELGARADLPEWLRGAVTAALQEVGQGGASNAGC